MPSSLVWFRRDLRCHDHAALARALESSDRVFCVFVFDSDILDALSQRSDRRVEFIHDSIVELDSLLDGRSRAAGGAGSGLIVRHGRAADVIPQLAVELGVDAVWCNRDYEPEALRRDEQVWDVLRQLGVKFHSCKDQVVFEKDEVLTRSGTPFSVFTPYARAWREALLEAPCEPHDCRRWAFRLAAPPQGSRLPGLSEIGFGRSNLESLRLPTGASGGARMLQDFDERMRHYRERRDFPALKGPSYLSVHLRFGTVSIRELVMLAASRRDAGADTWLNELIWREFYQMILWHHPRVVSHNFKRAFDQVEWDEWPEGLQAWCEGRTGYPLVDAAMRQLNRTGYMHNRLRMVTASFLSKDLGLHWLAGERYFAAQLNDYELASNNGGWQWAASTGCDAQPWFRIFNPVTQSKRFDPDGAFIRRYVPELKRVPDKAIHAPWQLDDGMQRDCGVVIGRDYPPPVVDHARARARTLERFAVLKRNEP